MVEWIKSRDGFASSCGRFALMPTPKGWFSIRFTGPISALILAESPLYRSEEAARAWCEGVASEVDAIEESAARASAALAEVGEEFIAGMDDDEPIDPDATPLADVPVPVPVGAIAENACTYCGGSGGGEGPNHCGRCGGTGIEIPF